MRTLDIPVADRRYRRAQRRVKRAEERLVRAQARLGIAVAEMHWAHRVRYLRNRAIESMVANDNADEF